VPVAGVYFEDEILDEIVLFLQKNCTTVSSIIVQIKSSLKDLRWSPECHLVCHLRVLSLLGIPPDPPLTCTHAPCQSLVHTKQIWFRIALEVVCRTNLGHLRAGVRRSTVLCMERNECVGAPANHMTHALTFAYCKFSPSLHRFPSLPPASQLRAHPVLAQTQIFCHFPLIFTYDMLAHRHDNSPPQPIRHSLGRHEHQAMSPTQFTHFSPIHTTWTTLLPT
jgi:hypothetical protein